MGAYLISVDNGDDYVPITKIYQTSVVNLIPEYDGNGWENSDITANVKSTAEPSIIKTVTDFQKKSDNYGTNDTIPFNIVVPITDLYYDKTLEISDTLGEGLMLGVDSVTVSLVKEEYNADGEVIGYYDSAELSGDLYTITNREELDGLGGFTLSIRMDNNTLTQMGNMNVDWEEYDALWIRYDAMTNDKFCVKYYESDTLESNENTATLTVDNNYRAESKATVYTYGIDLTKIDANSKELLSGVEFTLRRKDGDYESQELYFKFNEEKGAYYQVQEGVLEDCIITTDDNGSIRIIGLDEGTYLLQETKALDGYKRLSNSIEFTIEDGRIL